jgi:hypothetical protein
VLDAANFFDIEHSQRSVSPDKHEYDHDLLLCCSFLVRKSNSQDSKTIARPHVVTNVGRAASVNNNLIFTGKSLKFNQ